MCVCVGFCFLIFLNSNKNLVIRCRFLPLDDEGKQPLSRRRRSLRETSNTHVIVHVYI